MGQAKHRGTFEERLKKAQERSAQLKQKIETLSIPPVRQRRNSQVSQLAAVSAIIALATFPPSKKL